MDLNSLDFSYPEHLIAAKPERPSRVLWTDGKLCEMTIPEMLSEIKEGDLVVRNNTKVLKRRVFAGDLEILFITEISPLVWQVLFPAKKLKIGDQIKLPSGHLVRLLEKGIPQLVQADSVISEFDFEKMAELPIPPYIQKIRQKRHITELDSIWYQTDWAKNLGSLAAPTASFHFLESDFANLKSRGVKVADLTLHVGLGTFLPIQTEDLSKHQMHKEFFEISPATWRNVEETKKNNGKIWALGTTVARALETVALVQNGLPLETNLAAQTDLFIRPGFNWQVVNFLMTNFHQPKSTLLSLVASFTDLPFVLESYKWAIAQNFRLFSYGDLSVWKRQL